MRSAAPSLADRATGNWYDLTCTLDGEPDWTRRFAGRVETDQHGITDPALGL